MSIRLVANTDVEIRIEELLSGKLCSREFGEIISYARAMLDHGAQHSPWLGVHGLDVDVWRAYVASRDVERRYSEHHENEPLTASNQPRCDVPFRQDSAIRISGLQISELRVLRRRLALMHHPDTVPAIERARAEKKMSRFNELIDQEIAARRRGQQRQASAD